MVRLPSRVTARGEQGILPQWSARRLLPSGSVCLPACADRPASFRASLVGSWRLTHPRCGQLGPVLGRPPCACRRRGACGPPRRALGMVDSPTGSGLAPPPRWAKPPPTAPANGAGIPPAGAAVTERVESPRGIVPLRGGYARRLPLVKREPASV